MKTTIFVLLSTLIITIHAGQNELSCESSSSPEAGQRKLIIVDVQYITIGGIRYPVMRMSDLEIDPKDVSLWNSGEIAFKSGEQDKYEVSGLQLYRNVVLVTSDQYKTFYALVQEGFTQYKESVTLGETKICMFKAPVGQETNPGYLAAFLPLNLVFS